MSKNKPIFNRRIFWDVDYDRMDVDLKEQFIIERVFERGDVEDIRECRRYYGDGKVKQILISAKYLPERRLYLAAVVVQTPITEFRCYKNRLSPQIHLPY